MTAHRLLALTLSFLPVALLHAGWPAGTPVPPHEHHWQRAPGQDPLSLLLWKFDQHGAAKMTGTLAELDAGDVTTAKPTALVTEAGIAFALGGDAKLCPEGRFGGGLQLGGKGFVQAINVDWNGLLGDHPAVTLDFSICPDVRQAATPAVLAALPGAIASVGVFRLELAADGALVLRAGATELLRHPRRAPAGAWTHVALVLEKHGGVRVLVQGTPAALTDEARSAAAYRAWAARRGNRLIVGALPDAGAGFCGRFDEVRLTRGERYFYALDDGRMCAPQDTAPVVQAPPYFVRRAIARAWRFDGSASAAGETGETPALPEDAFAPGVRGQALNTSALADTPGLPGVPPDILAQGTLEFWFRPVGWNNFFVGKDYFGMDVPYGPLLTLERPAGEKSAVVRTLRLAFGTKGGDVGAGKLVIPFHPGKWTHLILSWGPRGQFARLDGQAQELPQAFWQGAPRQKGADGKELPEADGPLTLRFAKPTCWVDELKFYPYAFSHEEAVNAYWRYFPEAKEKLKPLPPIRADFEYYAHAWDPTERLDVRLSCLPVNEVPPVAAKVRILGPDGTTQLFAADDVKLDGNGAGSVLVRQAFPFGSYPVEVAIRAADGKELKADRLTYTRERPPWYENTLGKEPTVPPPWTPIAAKDDATLQVWGRTIRLGAGGLPAAITAVERELLAAPATVTATLGGQATPLTGAPAKLTERADHLARWTGRLAGGALALDVGATLEFDGLLYYTLTLRPTAAGQPVTVDALRVDFPLRAAEVSQLIANSGAHNFRAAYDVRFIAPGTGCVWDSRTARPKMPRPFPSGNLYPQLWVGGDYCGLSFSADNDQGWTPDNEHAAQELHRDGETVLYRMNVITKPVTVAKERAFTFIVLPTPSKPLPPEWRGWNRAPKDTPNARYDLIDVFMGKALTDEPGRPAGEISFKLEPVSWEDATAQAEDMRRSFGAENPVLMYIDYSWPRLGPSFRDWNHDLHAGTGRMAWMPAVEDYMTYTMNEYIRRGLIDGIYIDDTSLGATFSMAATAYPFPEVKEQRRVGFSSMGFRRFLQRTYRLLVAQGKTPHIIPHMTYCFELPALSFCESMVNGEDRDIFPYDGRDAIQTWGVHELRIMGNGPKWGIGTFWKPTIQKTEMAMDREMLGYWLHRQSRAMHALIVPHDVWYFWTYPSARTIESAFTTFGLHDKETRFVPYWETAPLVTLAGAEPAKTLVGFWVKPRRALLMVSNLDKADHEVTLTVDPAKLFGPAAGAGASLTWTDVDPTLLAPPNPRAVLVSDKKAMATGSTAAITGDTGIASTKDALGELDVVDPVKVEKARLAPKVTGNQATILVRGHDYRLLELGVK